MSRGTQRETVTSASMFYTFGLFLYEKSSPYYGALCLSENKNQDQMWVYETREPKVLYYVFLSMYLIS